MEHTAGSKKELPDPNLLQDDEESQKVLCSSFFSFFVVVEIKGFVFLFSSFLACFLCYFSTFLL